MAHKVIKESTNILQKVLTGVITGVLVTVTLYFLFNKKPKATEAEVRKVTIARWKEFVTAENKTQTAFDSSYAQVTREISTTADATVRNAGINAFCKRDSNTANAFLAELEKLKSSENVDPDFAILMNTREEYLKQMITSSLKYNRNVQHIMDSSIQQNVMLYLMQEAQRKNTERSNNISVRVGRNIDYFADVLSKKYQYPFAPSDLNMYYNYRALKRSKKIEQPSGVAPPDPGEKR